MDKNGEIINTFEDVHKDTFITIKCCFDHREMNAKKYIKRISKKGNEILYPIYACTYCGKEFTSNENSPNKGKIIINGKEYINLTPRINGVGCTAINSSKVRILKKASFYIYDRKPNRCFNLRCPSGSIERCNVEFRTNDGKKIIDVIKWCNNCKAYYLPKDKYGKYKVPYNIINEDEFSKNMKQINNIIKEEKKDDMKTKVSKKNDRKLSKWLENYLSEDEGGIKNYSISNKDNSKEVRNINYKDFVVRRSVFKCMHNNHKVIDIVANVNIINKNDRETNVKINAGYCKNCSVYFILESTYDYLKRLGIILCRISDEKNYLKGINNSSMKLASESILMQYGYNVSQGEGLSQTTRRKILATLIDRHILSKNEIISYLDFFINQRQSNSKYQIAISKWELDREFVENYKIGKYKEIGVLGLSR